MNTLLSEIGLTDLPHRLGTTLVTGANGFVGSNLVAGCIGCGVKTVAAMRNGRTLPDNIVKNVSTRILRDTSQHSMYQLLDGIDTIFHVAGSVAAPNYRSFLEANFVFTRRLMQVASEMEKPPLVVLISSVSAAGPTSISQAKAPKDKPVPVSLYGRSKLAGERAATKFAARVPLTILRPGIVFGPGDREVYQLMRLIKYSHLNLLPGYRNPRFPFVAVSDLVQAALRAAALGERVGVSSNDAHPKYSGHGVYFVANPEMLSFAKFGRGISKALQQYGFVNIPVPMFIVTIVAAISQACSDTQKPSTFNLDKIREARAASWECDVAKTITHLRWAPTSLEDSLAETIRWYKSNGML